MHKQYKDKFNILLCLNHDIFSNYALNLLSPILEKHHITLSFSYGVGNIDKILKEFNIFDKLSIKNITRKKLLNFTQLISKYHLNPVVIDDVNHKDSCSLIDGLELDLIISIRYGQIFHTPVINMPRYGILNLHSGALPKYAGIMATFHAMKNNEKNLGMTLHYIQDNNIDTGNIIDITYIKNLKHNSFVDNLFSLYDNGCAMLITYFHKIFYKEKIGTVAQDLSLRKYYNYPTELELKQFETSYKLY